MSGHTTISRRSLLAGPAACAVLSSTARPARSAGRKITFRLDYPYQGATVGFPMARERGFYEAAGLDVDVGPGKGGSLTAQLVASKAVDFGYADGFVVGAGVSKGMDIRNVAAIYRRNPAALIVLDTSAIKAPKDLEGKTIAIPAGGGIFQQWPAYAKSCGIDASSVRLVNIDPAGNIPALLTGRVDAVGAFPMTFVPDLEARTTAKVRSFWFADAGVTIVGNGILAHNDLIRAEPDLVRAFVRASLRGFMYARAHPDEAGAIVHQYLPTVDAAAGRRQTELSWQTWVTPNTRNRPIGWMAEPDWQATVDLLHQIGVVTGPLAVNRLYTNDFVPTDPDFIPPQT